MKKALIIVLLSVSLLTACGITPPPSVTEVPQAVESLTSGLTPTIALTPTQMLTPTPVFTPTITPTPLGGGSGKIAFVSERDGNPEIYVMNSDGSGQTRLTNNPDTDNYPDWSPDGKKIVFRSERNHDIYVIDAYLINADGSNETNLTDFRQSSMGLEEPKWSPDGKTIAFVAPDSDTRKLEIYVMNADGSGKKRITHNQYDDEYFQWSPDSQKIVFWSYRDENGDIYVVNVDGSNEIRLTNHPMYSNYRFNRYNIDPFWSPDGKRIIYLSEHRGPGATYELYTVNPDGGKEINLTKDIRRRLDNWEPSMVARQ